MSQCAPGRSTAVGGIGLARWGLVVVDLQNDFLSAAGYYARRRELDEQVSRGTMTAEARDRLLSQPGPAPSGSLRYRAESLPRLVSNILLLVEHARQRQRPIAYLQATYSRHFAVQPPPLRREPHRQHYPCRPDTWGGAFIDPIREVVAARHRGSCESVIAKHTFDGFRETELLSFLRDDDVQTVVITGVETHACVLATAQSASSHQFNTVIPEDCVWTANEALGQAALAIFRDAFGTTSRCVNDLIAALDAQS